MVVSNLMELSFQTRRADITQNGYSGVVIPSQAIKLCDYRNKDVLTLINHYGNHNINYSIVYSFFFKQIYFFY